MKPKGRKSTRAAGALTLTGVLFLLLALAVRFNSPVQGQAATTLGLTISPTQIGESANRNATITVAITGGDAFSADQTIALTFGGTAGSGDFTVLDASDNTLSAPYQLTLAAGATSVTAKIRSEDDDFYEGAETIEVTAMHNGVPVGAAQAVTITDEDDRAQITDMFLREGEVESVDMWPFALLVRFDRRVAGLEPHEVNITNGRVLDVSHFVTNLGSINDTIYVLLISASGDAGEKLTVRIPENVVDGGNAASAAAVDFEETISGTDAEVTDFSTGAEEPVSGNFDVDVEFSVEICFDDGVDENPRCFNRPPSQNLSESAFQVAGGAATGFGRHSRFNDVDRVFVLTVRPGRRQEGKITVVLPEHAAATLDGGRTGGGNLEVEVDTLGPQLVAATVTSDTITLSYHEPIVTFPPSSIFTVWVDGSEVDVTSLLWGGTTLDLELAQAVTSGQPVTLTYSAGHRIGDAHGNGADAATDITVDSEIDTRAPSVSEATILGAIMTIVFDEPLNSSSVPDAGDFTVTVDGAAEDVETAAISGAVLRLTLATEVIAGQSVLISYAPGTNKIQDVGGTDAAAFSVLTVMNETRPTPPLLLSATVNGSTLVMEYSEALYELMVPAAEDFEVVFGGLAAGHSGELAEYDIEGSPVDVESVVVSDSTVTLELAQAAVHDERVVLSYSHGISPLQDIGGTGAAALDMKEVVNETPDPGPELVSAVLKGTALTLTYSEALDTSSVPGTEDFVVRYTGGAVDFPNVSIGSVSIMGLKVVLEMSVGIGPDSTNADVSYTPGTNPIRDEGETAAAALSQQEVAIDTVPVQASFVYASATVVEGEETTITVSLDKDPERIVTIPLLTETGGGADASEFTGVPITVRFVSGQTSRNFTFTSMEDTDSEGQETVAIKFGTLPDWVSAGSQAASVVTISDDDPPAKVTGVGVTERNLRLQVDWTAVEHATGYKVQWKSLAQIFDHAPGDNREAIVSGGTNTSHTILGLVNGREYTVRVIATKTGAADGPPSDEATGTPVQSNAPVTGKPTITGQPQVGKTLRADVSGISDPDGPAQPSFSYQWIRVDGVNEEEITGATNASYRLQDADEGKKVKVKVSFTDGNATLEEVTSDAFPFSGSIEADEPDVVLLVSNRDRDFPSEGDRGIQAQSFRTGTRVGGYTLTTVEVRLSAGAAVDPNETYVTVRENSSGEPGELVARLSSPASFSAREALHEFKAPAGTLLYPNKTYWIVLNEGTTGVVPIPGLTFGGQEDSGSQAGWRIGDDSLFHIQGSTNWIDDNAIMGIRIRGILNDDATLNALALADPDDSDAALALNEAFDVDRLNYTATVANEVERVRLTATANSMDAIVVIADDNIPGSPAEAVLDLDEGVNTLRVTVTSADGHAERSYTITVTRLKETPAQVTDAGVATFNQRLLVDWTEVAGATGYKVQWTSGSETFADAAAEDREATVSGGSSTTYSITGLANGTEYTVRVIATKTGAADGLPSAEVMGTPNPNPATGKPTISGTAQVGETLTADTSMIDDADGLAGATYSFQWVRVDGGTDTNIAGANVITYTLRDADATKKVRVQVTFEDDDGNEESLTSDAYPATGTVAAATLPANTEATGAPAISGTAKVGQTLTASEGTIEDDDGLTNPSFGYQWIRVDGGDTEIAGATGETYKLTPDDAGKRVKVKAVFVDDEGHEESRTSSAYPSGSDPIEASSADATLKSLNLRTFAQPRDRPLTPAFAPATTTYTATFDNTESPLISFIAEANDVGATIIVGDSPDVVGGTPGHQLALEFGENVVPIVVTAEDGVATETYTVTVTRLLPKFSFSSISYTFDEDADSGEISVELNQPHVVTATISYRTEDLTAKAGEDYTAAAGTLSFSPGSTSESITVPIAGNNVFEGDRTFRVYISSPTAATLAAEEVGADVDIVDNEGLPTASMADVSVAEETGIMTLTLALNHASSEAIRYTLDDGDVGGTATEPDDFSYDRNLTATSAQVTVPAGELSASFGVLIVDELNHEADETIEMKWKLTGERATPGELDFTGTIENIDPQIVDVVVSFDQSSYQVDESESVTITVNLDADPERTVSIPISTTNQGGATSFDYSGAPTSITFNAGEQRSRFRNASPWRDGRDEQRGDGVDQR